MLFYLQLVGALAGIAAFVWFAQCSLAIMRFRKFSTAGLMQLWTGNIDTRQLITANGQAPGKIEKDLVKAVIRYKRSRTALYAALLVNVIIFLANNLFSLQ